MAINQTPTVSPTDDHVGPSLAMEMALRGLVAILLIVSMLSVARLFGYDTSQMPWNPLNLRAGSIALGIDGFFFLALYLARGFWTKRYPNWSSRFWGLSWFIGALVLGLFSWFSNSIFFSDTIPVTQAQLNAAGFGWLTRAEVVQGLGLLTPLIVLWYSFVPRREKLRSLAEIEVELTWREGMQKLQARELALRAQSANTVLDTSMDVATKALNRVFKLDERKAAKAQAEAEKQLRREVDRQRTEERAQMHVLALQQHLLSEDEQDMEEELESGPEMDVWYQKIEKRLRDVGLWPLAVAALPDVPTLQQVALAAEREESGEMEKTSSGNHYIWMVAEQIAKELHVSANVASKMIETRSRHRYAIPGCKDFIIGGKKVRKAHYQAVEMIGKKMEADRLLRQQSAKHRAVKSSSAKPQQSEMQDEEETA